MPSSLIQKSHFALGRLSVYHAMLFGLCLWACRENPISTPLVPDEGLLILDSGYVIDAFPFDSAACVETNAGGFAAADSIPAGTLALVKVVSTACYRVHVKVEDSTSRTVRSFDRQFFIVGRHNGDKNRGVEGYIAWDGRDDLGQSVPIARYLWRMEFDFGGGHLRKVRADIRLD
jgi:hypothetical protein